MGRRAYSPEVRRRSWIWSSQTADRRGRHAAGELVPSRSPPGARTASNGPPAGLRSHDHDELMVARRRMIVQLETELAVTRRAADPGRLHPVDGNSVPGHDGS
jgi:hypothetical protein